MNRPRVAAFAVLLLTGLARLAASGDTPSIQRGEALVTTGGGGRTVRCALCHGDDLRGLGQAPAIAGLSSRYLVRQLTNIQNGRRRGLRSDLMGPTVARLTTADMRAIADYLASRAQ